MVRVVLQLLQRTVGANDLHASRTVTLEGEPRNSIDTAVFDTAVAHI